MIGGPVVPRAEKAIETENAQEVIDFVTNTAKEELQHRFKHAMAKKKYAPDDVDVAREYVQAMLGFVLFSNRVYAYVKGGGEHGEGETSGHKH